MGGVTICTKPTPNLPIHESITQRSAQKQRWWKIVTHFCADGRRLKLFFRTLISVNQLSIYGEDDLLWQDNLTIVCAKCDEDT